MIVSSGADLSIGCQPHQSSGLSESLKRSPGLPRAAETGARRDSAGCPPSGRAGERDATRPELPARECVSGEGEQDGRTGDEEGNPPPFDAAGLQGVCDITAALSDPTRELSRVLPGAARRARALLGCDTVGIALGAPGELTVPYAFGPNALRLEAAEAFATEEEIAPRIAPLSCLLSYFGDGQTGGAIVIVNEGGPGPWRKDVADVLARHVGAAVHASRAADQARDELIAESDERARELAIRLERESQELALAAQESERARIARELHDETGQLLTAISLRLKGFGPRLEDPVLAAEIDELRGHVRGVQTAIRTFLGQLRPVNLERGLGSAVAQLAGRRLSRIILCFRGDV